MSNAGIAEVRAAKQEIKELLTSELHLELSEEKTRITHVNEGFDFLGFVRHEVAYTAVMTKGSDITWCAATSTLPSHAAGVI